MSTTSVRGSDRFCGNEVSFFGWLILGFCQMVDQALQPDMWVPEHCAVALQGGWTHARGRWDSLCGVWNVIPLGMVLRVSMTDSASSPLAVFTRSTATPIPLTPTRGASPASPPVSYLRAPTARDIWDRRGSAGFPLPVVSLMLTYADEMT